MFRKLNPGTYFPMTTTHTVIGVERSNPTGPHSQVQNAAANSTASVVNPVLDPNSSGSSALAAMISIIRKPPITSSPARALSYTASDSSSGMLAATHTPMYGMNRSSATSSPNSAGLGNGLPLSLPTPHSSS